MLLGAKVQHPLGFKKTNEKVNAREKVMDRNCRGEIILGWIWKKNELEGLTEARRMTLENFQGLFAVMTFPS